MLFTNKQQITTKSGEVKPYEVVIACTYEGSAISAASILSNLNLFGMISKVYSIKVVKTFEMKNPILVFDGVSDDVLNISSLYSQVIPIYNKSEETFNKMRPQIIGLLKQQLKDEAAHAENLLEAVILHYKTESGVAMIDIATFGATQVLTEFLEDTMRFVNAQRSKVIFTENKFQKECTDPIMFRLPSRDEMEHEGIKTSDIMPTREQICEPYKYATAYDVWYDQPSSGIPKDYYPYIEGKVENNTLPIQENEQEFYDTLVEWIQNNLRYVYAEKLDSMSEKDFILDGTTEAYLNMLIERVYHWHWGHSEHVPMKLKENLHDDGDDEDGSVEKSNYEFIRKPGNEDKPIYAAYEPLRNFLRQAAQHLDYKVYAEALIKIARWGDRKPKALVFENYSHMFNLEKGISDTNIGSISDYQEVVDNNGHTHVPVSTIFCKTPFADKSFVMKQDYPFSGFGMPIGMSFAQFFINKKNEDRKLTMYRYLTMPEVVRELYSKKAGVETEIIPVGMYVDDEGNIRVTKEITNDKNNTYEKLREVYLAKKSTLLANPFYSKGMSNLYLELNLTDANKELDLFKVLTAGLQTTGVEQAMNDQAFSTKEELIENFQSGKIWDMDTAINLSVYKEMYAIYISVAKQAAALLKERKMFTVENVLNWFKDAMLECDYKWETGFLKEMKQPIMPMRELYNKALGISEDEVPVDVNTNNEPTTENNGLEKMELFGAAESTPIEEAPVKEVAQGEEAPVEEVAQGEETPVEEVVPEEETLVGEKESIEDTLVLDDVQQKQEEPIIEKVVERVIEKVIEQVPMTNTEFIEQNFIRKVTDLNATNVFYIFNKENKFIGYVHMEIGATAAENKFTVLENEECVGIEGINDKKAININRLSFHVIKQLLTLSTGGDSLIYFSSVKALKSFCDSMRVEVS